MRYTVGIFTRDIIDGEWDDEHCLARYESDSPIPIPHVNDIICLETGNGLYKVTELDYYYPDPEDKYEFDTTVVVEACK